MQYLKQALQWFKRQHILLKVLMGLILLVIVANVVTRVIQPQSYKEYQQEQARQDSIKQAEQKHLKKRWARYRKQLQSQPWDSLKTWHQLRYLKQVQSLENDTCQSYASFRRRAMQQSIRNSETIELDYSAQRSRPLDAQDGLLLESWELTAKNDFGVRKRVRWTAKIRVRYPCKLSVYDVSTEEL